MQRFNKDDLVSKIDAKIIEEQEIFNYLLNSTNNCTNVKRSRKKKEIAVLKLIKFLVEKYRGDVLILRDKDISYAIDRMLEPRRTNLSRRIDGVNAKIKED